VHDESVIGGRFNLGVSSIVNAVGAFRVSLVGVPEDFVVQRGAAILECGKEIEELDDVALLGEPRR
jgi:hypothetical protein